MLESQTRDIAAMKRARKKIKKTTVGRQIRSSALGRPAMKLMGVGRGLQLVCGDQPSPLVLLYTCTMFVAKVYLIFSINKVLA